MTCIRNPHAGAEVPTAAERHERGGPRRGPWRLDAGVGGANRCRAPRPAAAAPAACVRDAGNKATGAFASRRGGSGGQGQSTVRLERGGHDGAGEAIAVVAATARRPCRVDVHDIGYCYYGLQRICLQSRHQLQQRRRRRGFAADAAHSVRPLVPSLGCVSRSHERAWVFTCAWPCVAVFSMQRCYWHCR